MQLNIQKNEFYLLEGPARVTVDSGCVEIIAAQVVSGKSLEVPVGKKIPILGIDNSALSIEASQDA
ncbi:MAG: hypothetical protein AB1403_13210, partial [Candidatus Riflebacteria bacterium]